MKLFNYDRASRMFLDESDAEPDPMEPGNFIIPANATPVPPPAPQAGMVAIFDPTKGVWSLVASAKPDASADAAPVSFSVKAASWRVVVKAYADMVARSFDFDDMAEAVTYADEPAVPKFQVLGAALRAWRSILWASFDEMCAHLSAGFGTEPQSDAEMLGLLPDFVPPDVSGIGIEPYVAPDEGGESGPAL